LVDNISDEYDEDMQELMDKTDEILKKHGAKSTKHGVIEISINTPGKIIRFRKRTDKEKKPPQSAFLLDESVKGIME